jgi:hypothetical protein
MASSDRRPLTPAQQETAASLPWYRAWLQRMGWHESDLDPGSDRDNREE